MAIVSTVNTSVWALGRLNTFMCVHVHALSYYLSVGRSHYGNDGGGALCESYPDNDRRGRLQSVEAVTAVLEY